MSTPFPEEEKSILFTFLLYIRKLLTLNSLSYYNTSPALAIASNATVLCPPPTSLFLSASLLSVSTSLLIFPPRPCTTRAFVDRDNFTFTYSFSFLFSLPIFASFNFREFSSPSRNSPISRNLSPSTLSIFRSRAPAIDDRPSWILPALPGAYLAIEIGL